VFDAVSAAVAQERQCTMLLHSMAGTGKSFTINADEQVSKGAKEQPSCAAAATDLAPKLLSSRAD
jgi:hypothetical protein